MMNITITYSKGFEIFNKKQSIDALEEVITSMPQADCPVREYFLDGLYAREVTIPKNVVCIGAIHTKQNFAVLRSGILRLATEDGWRDVYAGEIIQIMPGNKNCGFAIEECVWTNFLPNPTNERDSEKLVELFTESKLSDLLGGSTNKQLAANNFKTLGE